MSVAMAGVREAAGYVSLGFFDLGRSMLNLAPT